MRIIVVVLASTLLSSCPYRRVAVVHSFAGSDGAVYFWGQADALHYESGEQVLVERLMLIRCEQEPAQDAGALLTQCHQVVTGSELIPWLTAQESAQTAVFRHPAEPIHMWTRRSGQGASAKTDSADGSPSRSLTLRG